MTISKKLATAFFMTAALFASQVHAQQQALSGADLTAYQALATALTNNAGADEATDEAAVQAALNAGLSLESIAGALAESGRSDAQQAAALIPPNASQAQVNSAQTAMLNASNSQGTNVATVTPATVTAAITPAVPPTVIVPPAPVPQPTLVTNLGAPGAGALSLPTNTLTPTTTSSGPSITDTAFATDTPIIPITATDSLTEPEVAVPQTQQLHII